MKGTVSTAEGILFAIGGCTLVLSIIVYVLGEFGWLEFINPATLGKVVLGILFVAVIVVFVGFILFITRRKT